MHANIAHTSAGKKDRYGVMGVMHVKSGSRMAAQEWRDKSFVARR